MLDFSPSLLDVRFVVLLCVLGLARKFLPSRHSAALGVIGSAVLVGFAAPKTFLVIFAVAVLYLFPLHRLMKVRAGNGTYGQRSTLWLTVGIGGLVGALVVFKLYRHFTIPWLGSPLLRSEVVSLVGFSYFIFRAISFLHLQAITKINETTPWPILYYCLFPPTLTSGPIQKYTDFRLQLDQPAPLDRQLVAAASYRILRGCFRKLFVAFILNRAFEAAMLPAEQTVLLSSAAIVLLYLYFYYDFAGYSDMAIGYGLLMGIRVPENFRKPFLATNVSEFWRNWHITLVDWFRDNVFIPLGGMQSTRLRAGMLALLVMMLCGLWHGLTLALFAWGTWHGVMLLIEAVSGSKPMPPSRRHGLRFWSRVVWTNARVALPSVLFLPDTDSALRLLRGLTHWVLY
jgi:alginate O-acetyltransferase complex protein AlgI